MASHGNPVVLRNGPMDHSELRRQGEEGEARARCENADELLYREDGNMPQWAADEPSDYWQAADAGERANGSLYREVQFALPQELSESEQVDLARDFAQSLTTNGERLPYTLAVHRGDGENPHAHLVMSERVNDGQARTAETWFKRHNAQEPQSGDAAGVADEHPAGLGTAGE